MHRFDSASLSEHLHSHSARQASVGYLFSRKGSITFQPKEDVSSDAALDAAIEVGAEDVDVAENGEVEVRVVLPCRYHNIQLSVHIFPISLSLLGPHRTRISTIRSRGSFKTPIRTIDR